MGKTYNTKTGTPTIRKHPHGRGEDLLISLIVEGYQETPPRAWGRHENSDKYFSHDRNTPTGVGKTAHSKFKWLRYYNTFFPFVKELGSVCADFSIISCSPDMDVKSFVGMPFA